MRIAKTTSERMEYLRFTLIVAIVYMHGSGGVRYAEGGSAGATDAFIGLRFLQETVGQVVARTGVPMFFLISSYLVFLKFSENKFNYPLNIKSRIKTLLVPYLIWNVAVLLLYAAAQAIPGLRVYFSGSNAQIATYGTYDFLNSVLGITKNPIASQLWFVRDLIKLTLLAPAFWYAANTTPLISLSALSVLWILEINAMPIFYSFEPPFFYLLGAILVAKETDLTLLDRHKTLVILSYCFVAVFVGTILTLDMTTARYQVVRASTLLGIPAFWVVWAGNGLERCKRHLMSLGSVAFFVFLTHEPTQLIVRKVFLRFVPIHSEFVSIVHYLATPSIVIAALVVVARIMQRSMPRVYGVISGGRQA